MSRKFSILVAFCTVLFGALLAGYWDMLDSEKLRAMRDEASNSVAELTGTRNDGAPASADDATAAASEQPMPASQEEGRKEASLGAPATGRGANAGAGLGEIGTGGGDAASAPDGSTPGSASRPVAPAGLPSFDILRVEPDGSAVLAGRAAPNAEVRLVDGDRTIGTAKASAGGDFAIVLDSRLTPGDHQIRIEATAGDGTVSVSQEAAIVSIPRPGEPGELLAMVEAPNKPSRIITLPSAKPGAEAAAASSPAATPAKPTTVASTAAAPSPFAVEAVEVENGKVYVAGRAPGSAPVRVYIDDKLIGEDARRRNGRFLVTAKAPLAVGDHRVRADMIGAGGVVASRVEVPFARPEGDAVSAIASAGAPASGDIAEAAGANGSSGDAATDAVETIRQPALESVRSRVLIRRGDTLWRISRQAYGAGRRYTVIYVANGDQIRNPNRIYPGQVFHLPEDEAKPAPTALN